MKNKKLMIVNCIFSVAFVAMIFIPFCLLDTTEIIDSTLENRRMTMWPGWHFNQEMNEWYGHYVEDRVAFREEAVQFYMDATYAIFGEFSEDLHMYGKEGEIFPADEPYIRAYQHLATDEELIDSFVTYLDRTNRYLAQKEIPFIFLAGLDKKSVYGEYMPDYIRVDESRESIMEMLSRKLDEAGVDYVIPIEEFREIKQQKQIYNSKFDSAHWNAYGTMAGLRILDEHIRVYNPDAPILSEEAFDLTFEKKRVEFISLPVEEEVPVYTLKPEYADSIHRCEELPGQFDHVLVTGLHHYINEEAQSDKSILILGDSFILDNWQYFAYRYKDVYMITRQNYEQMKLFVDQLEPDIVVFENAERAFVDDLYAYTNLKNVTYD